MILHLIELPLALPCAVNADFQIEDWNGAIAEAGIEGLTLSGASFGEALITALADIPEARTAPGLPEGGLFNDEATISRTFSFAWKASSASAGGCIRWGRAG
ncbi:hypothetical protein [Rhodobacter capsulatus]|uniref:hypothetical protein n=1 Tax=Rhodobacter capsulatus TaxID=1061 RepID=UPI0003D2B86D|nr:hypothetical protein [Rhodobacter capsulatus]ETD81602.1 hypothetical protein U716_10575 [Rhodobacter capsulatus B6]